MAEPRSTLPHVSPEHRRIAAGQFEHANQVIASKKSYNYGIDLLLSCCKLDPGNLIYRQALRRSQKAKYNNNLRGSLLSWLTSLPAQGRVKKARQFGNHLKVLEHGETVLCLNPWHVGTQMDMAAAADALGLIDLAAWTLEQARQKVAFDPKLNRALALIYEKRGNFTQASALWGLVRKANPNDPDAASKMMELAASDTMKRGNYQTTAAAPAEDEPAPPASASPVIPAKAQKQPRGEAETLRAKVDADPKNVNAWMHLANYYRRQDNFDKASAVLTQALVPTGNAFEVAVELADLQAEPFRRNLAVTEEKLKSKPDDEDLKKLLLRLRKEINTRELDLFRRKAEYFPSELQHRLDLGIRLLRAGLADEAIRELQTVRGDARHKVQAAYYLGLCFKSRNNWPLALRNFDEALQNLGPGDKELRKDLLFNLAHGAAQSGDLTRAIEVGQDLAFQDYNYRDIGRLVEEWQARKQQVG